MVFNLSILQVLLVGMAIKNADARQRDSALFQSLPESRSQPQSFGQPDAALQPLKGMLLGMSCGCCTKSSAG
jgi:hypothetical protein